jgi:hypothetical protein
LLNSLCVALHVLHGTAHHPTLLSACCAPRRGPVSLWAWSLKCVIWPAFNESLVNQISLNSPSAHTLDHPYTQHVRDFSDKHQHIHQHTRCTHTSVHSSRARQHVTPSADAHRILLLINDPLACGFAELLCDWTKPRRPGCCSRAPPCGHPPHRHTSALSGRLACTHGPWRRGEPSLASTCTPRRAVKCTAHHASSGCHSASLCVTPFTGLHMPSSLPHCLACIVHCMHVALALVTCAQHEERCKHQRPPT